MNKIVAIQKLNHYYQEGQKQRQVLFGIDFEIYAKEVVILTGESGSGKTTLLSLIGCLRAVQDGSLEVLGQQLKGVSNTQRMHIRRRIGYVFQHFNLLEFMTILQNVMISLELQADYNHHQALIESRKILEVLGLKKHLNSYPSDLSGGQKQRVAIARALVHRPPLILADEPTSSLDKRTGKEVIELITALAKEQGSAVFIVSHDSRIFGVANRLLAMEDGKLDVNYKGRLSIALPTLSDQQLTEFTPQLQILTFPAGATVIRQGELSNNFYILLEGEVEVIQEDENGNSKIINKLGSNSYFGEVGLLYKTKRTATVRATQDNPIKVVMIEYSTFHNIIAHSDLTYAVLNQQASQILARTLSSLNLANSTQNSTDKLLIQNFEPEQIIIEKGTLFEAIYIILEGNVIAFQETGLNTTIVKTFYPLDYFGCLDFFNLQKSSYQICAAKETSVKLLMITKVAFQALSLNLNQENFRKD